MAEMGSEFLSPGGCQEKYTFDSSSDVIRFSQGVNVVLSLEKPDGHRERDSARVHTTTISDYKGDVRSLTGRFLTVYGDLIAFRFYNEHTGDVIRVINRVNRNRHLIKGFQSTPIDVQFAAHAPLLAVLDNDCNLYVYSVNDEAEVTKSLVILNWPAFDSDDLDATPRVAWCPYVPENPSDETDVCHMLAVYKGKTVYVVNVWTIKQEKSVDQINFEEANQVEDGIHQITLEDTVTTVCISPDSTAVAVATQRGDVSFYLTNDGDLNFAHLWNPHMNRPIAELYFLDNIRSKTQEPFWRFVIAVGEGGRRFECFECEKWTSRARLRFESPFDLANFSVFVDPNASMLHVLNVDGSSLYCVELDRETKRFVSVTNIDFCHPPLAIVPFEVQTDATDAHNTSLDDDFESDESAGQNKVRANFVAIGLKSLSELEVTLDVCGTTTQPQPQTSPVKATSSNGEGVKEILTEFPSMENACNVGYPLPACALPVDDGKLDALLAKVGELSGKLERMQWNNGNHTAESNVATLQMLQNIEEANAVRHEQMITALARQKVELMDSVRAALAEQSHAVEGCVISAYRQSAATICDGVRDVLQEGLSTSTVSSVERLCGELFRQLNDSFRLGLEQYMQQMRALQSAALAAVAASATPAPLMSAASDTLSLEQLIRSNQIPFAFEQALNQGEEAPVLFVCKNVDPDALFTQDTNALSQPVLLSLLQQLSFRIQIDTELKFRYMEHIMEVLRPSDESICMMVPKVMEGTSKSLNDFQAVTQNQTLKRQARVINQLIKKLC